MWGNGNRSQCPVHAERNHDARQKPNLIGEGGADKNDQVGKHTH